MDKILSARVNEATIQKIGLLARELNMSKKAVIEAAITQYVEKATLGEKLDGLAATFGAWQRSEPVDETIQQARSAFTRSMERHRR